MLITPSWRNYSPVRSLLMPRPCMKPPCLPGTTMLWRCGRFFVRARRRYLQVRRAREAFFNQDAFIQRGIWDQNLFDGDHSTGFWPSWKYGVDQRVQGGCLRIDLGAVTDVDRLVLHVPDEYSLQPMLIDEGNFVDVSTDLIEWERVTFMAGTTMNIELSQPVRYLRFQSYPHRIMEIEGFKEGRALPRNLWRASNLFAHPRRMEPQKAWKAQVTLRSMGKGWLSLCCHRRRTRCRRRLCRF